MVVNIFVRDLAICKDTKPKSKLAILLLSSRFNLENLLFARAQRYSMAREVVVPSAISSLAKRCRAAIVEVEQYPKSLIGALCADRHHCSGQWATTGLHDLYVHQ